MNEILQLIEQAPFLEREALVRQILGLLANRNPLIYSRVKEAVVEETETDVWDMTDEELFNAFAECHNWDIDLSQMAVEAQEREYERGESIDEEEFE